MPIKVTSVGDLTDTFRLWDGQYYYAINGEVTRGATLEWTYKVLVNGAWLEISLTQMEKAHLDAGTLTWRGDYNQPGKAMLVTSQNQFISYVGPTAGYPTRQSTVNPQTAAPPTKPVWVNTFDGPRIKPPKPTRCSISERMTLARSGLRKDGDEEVRRIFRKHIAMTYREWPTCVIDSRVEHEIEFDSVTNTVVNLVLKCPSCK